jgi:hypothetical protein
MNRPTASAARGGSSSAPLDRPERAISASGRWVLKHLPSEVRFGRFRAKRSIG